LPRWIAKKLHSIATTDNHTTTQQPPRSSNPITIVCISDTHTTQPALPPGDILLHAGDLSQYGLFDEIQAQLIWLNAQPHRHKLVVAGNHDLLLDSAFVASHPDRELDRLPGKRRADLDWGAVTYLDNSTVDIACHTGGGERLLRIYGSPWTPQCGNFAFQYPAADADDKTDPWKNTIPPSTSILLTHGPPLHHLDERKGCPRLLKEIRRARPQLVVFGHIHGARGEDVLRLDDDAEVRYEDVVAGTRPWRNVGALVLLVVWGRL
ncbi:Metallo-dependent phosphatase, partial [Aulographum hederae CBS 113979]